MSHKKARNIETSASPKIKVMVIKIEDLGIKEPIYSQYHG
jgi:hypothetical protein